MDPSRYLDLFVSEARDHLEAAERAATRLAAAPADAAALRDLFRHFHSLKGMAASMGLAPMAARAHRAEEMLDAVRSGGRPFNDVAAAWIGDALRRLASDVDRAERGEGLDGTSSSDDPPPDDNASPGVPAATTTEAARGAVVWRVAMILRRDRPFPAVRAATVLGRLARLGTILRSDPVLASLRTGRFDGRLSVLLDCALDADRLGAEIARIDDVETFGVTADEAPAARPRTDRPPAWVRVRADLLDALLRDSLELLREQSRLDATLPREADVSLHRASLRCRSRAGRLHEDVLELRLAPFENLVRRLERGARELAAAQGKRLVLEIEGSDVRVDRSLLDALAEPLLHLLRNAVDHGIEAPGERAERGKAAEGRVALRTSRDRDRVEVVVEDDGRGIDPAALRRRAVEKGFLTSSAAAALDDAEALLLITLPGFSTSRRATPVSGRGVGLDVVRSAVEGLGGRMHVAAAPGVGARIRLVVPHTLSGVQSVLVRAGGELFAVPVGCVEGVVAPVEADDPDDVATISLARRLGLVRGPGRGSRGPRLLFSAGGKRYALEVDQIVGPGEVLLKPFRAPLQPLREYAGAGVIEDGSVVLVLEPAGLVRALVS